MHRVVHYSKKKIGPGWWDDKKKLDVIQSYILLGNLRQSAALNGVPEITAKKWKATAWWKEQEDDLRRGTKLKLSAKLSEVVDKAMIQWADRVDNGDFFFNRKTGDWLRKPISAEHANKITGQLIDRVIAVKKAATPEKITDEGLEARLTKLRQEMLSFAKYKPIPLGVIDVRSTDDVREVHGVDEGTSGSTSNGDSPPTPETQVGAGDDHSGDRIPDTGKRMADPGNSPTPG